MFDDEELNLLNIVLFYRRQLWCLFNWNDNQYLWHWRLLDPYVPSVIL